MEQFDLTSAINTSQTKWTLSYITFDWENSAIAVGLKGNNNERLLHTITGVTAKVLMDTLNTADCRTNSIHKRIFNKLRTDGIIANGLVTGSPD